jgi:hypothetical protein
MQDGPDGIGLARDLAGPELGLRRRRAERRRGMRLQQSPSPLWVLVVGFAGLLAPSHHADAQEPMAPPPFPGAYPISVRPHHWWSCLTANDGIPRTYSYYYTPAINQPIHFRVVGPNGKTYWRSAVRGLPLGTPLVVP